jgi:hypothetical protein
VEYAVDQVSSKNVRVVVVHGGYCCCAKYRQIIHVKLLGKASLIWGKQSGQYKEKLYYLIGELVFLAWDRVSMYLLNMHVKQLLDE